MQITLRWMDLDDRREENCESCGPNELNPALKSFAG